MLMIVLMKRRCAINKQNRAKNVIPHKTGSRAFVVERAVQVVSIRIACFMSLFFQHIFLWLMRYIS